MSGTKSKNAIIIKKSKCFAVLTFLLDFIYIINKYINKFDIFFSIFIFNTHHKNIYNHNNYHMTRWKIKNTFYYSFRL